MVEQICPTCGCVVDGEGYLAGGMAYCCQPCAEGSQCECGCCEVEEAEERLSG